MSIPTQASLVGFIATVPDLHFSKAGAPRFHARVGCEHFRKEADGSFTRLDPTFHDLVIFNDTALTAYERFAKGDSFLATGHVHEYDASAADGTTVIRDEFIARRIGHDAQRTRYDVRRRQPEPVAEPALDPVAEPIAESTHEAHRPAVGL
jgi:single-stranded DNA-binding protein